MFTYLHTLSSVRKSCVYVVGSLISSTVHTTSFEWAFQAWIQAAWAQSTATLRQTWHKVFNHMSISYGESKKGGLLIDVKQTYQPSSEHVLRRCGTTTCCTILHWKTTVLSSNNLILIIFTIIGPYLMTIGCYSGEIYIAYLPWVWSMYSD